MVMKDWQKFALIGLVVLAFWWLFVKKSGYSLCNLAEYASDTVASVAPPGMMVQSVADMSVGAETVVSSSVGMAPAADMGMGMGKSMYGARRGCGCNK